MLSASDLLMAYCNGAAPRLTALDDCFAPTTAYDDASGAPVTLAARAGAVNISAAECGECGECEE